MAKTHAEFGEGSFSWKYIEKIGLDNAIPDEVYEGTPRILDLGCGSGRIVNYHLERNGKSQITGVDINSDDLALARSRFPDATFYQNSMQDYDFNETYDLVSIVMAIHYLSDDKLAAMLSKARSSMSNSGLFVALDAHPLRVSVDDGIDRYLDEGKREIHTPWGDVVSSYYRTLGSYVSLFGEAGMRIRALKEITVNASCRDFDPIEYEKYALSPARFVITATAK